MPEGLYGPNSQMGLICANVDISASTAKMKRKNALVLAAKYGYAGAPTTFLSVRPLLGIWVCFWWYMKNRCAEISASSRAGISSTWMMYSRGMIRFPGNSPPNRKNDA